MHKKISMLAAAAATVLFAEPALAHHVMDGGLPDSFMAGLLSGFGHPIIGVDHFAFIVAMGVAAAFTANRYLSPLAFILATLAGCVVNVSGIALPGVEIVVAASIVVLGALILSGRAVSQGVYVGLFAVAGLFHGWAYGGSIVGAETTPLVAYMLGFAVIQYAIAVAAGAVVAWIWRATEPAAVKPRIAGAVAAGVGAAFLVENIEAILFG